MLLSVYEVLRKIASYSFRSPATENPPTTSIQGPPSTRPPKHESPFKFKKPGKPTPAPVSVPKPETKEPIKRPPDMSDRSDDTKKLRLFNQLKTLTNKRQQEIENAERENRTPDTSKIDNDKTKIDLQVNKINTNQLRRKKMLQR